MKDEKELVAYLQMFGWSEKKAKQFLYDKVSLQRIKVPAAFLLDVLQEVCKEGIPVGQVTLDFMVSHRCQQAFRARAEKAIAKHGGFVLTPEEKSLLNTEAAAVAD